MRHAVVAYARRHGGPRRLAGASKGDFGIPPDDQLPYLPAAAAVHPGELATFSFKLRFETCEATVRLTAQLSQTGTGPFGQSLVRLVDVTPAPSAACAGDPTDPATPVTWIDGTDVRQLPINANLTSVTISASSSSHLQWATAQTPFIQAKGAIASFCPQSGSGLWFVQHSPTRGGPRPDPRGRSQLFGPVACP